MSFFSQPSKISKISPKSADFGVCGGKGGENMIYVGGKPDHKVKSENIVDELVRLVEAKVS